MRFGIVGCGLIGRKRAAACRNHRIVAVADIDQARAAALSAQCGARAVPSWEDVIAEDLDAVVVATTHDRLAEITMAAVSAGRHVLVEKPAARSVAEIDPVVEAQSKSAVTVKVGFNHRFHPALRKAKEIADSGALGPLYFVRGRYGHGGRLGYEKEWRLHPQVSGGGELIDQGAHLIDLARWFLGDITEVAGQIARYYWDAPVEDNCFLSLRTAAGQTAWLHAGWTEWKNIFSFEIMGRDGKLQIDGLGGSYGPETLTYHRMLPQMGPPETSVFRYEGEDESWHLEIENFVEAVTAGRRPIGDLADAHAMLEIIGKVYGQSQ